VQVFSCLWDGADVLEDGMLSLCWWLSTDECCQ